MRNAFEIREASRAQLRAAESKFNRNLPSPIGFRPEAGWKLTSMRLKGRLDAAYYSPTVKALRDALLASGGQQIAQCATVEKPAGRYTTRYVGKAHGSPILSGTQILQAWPINLRYMPESAFDEPDAYRLVVGSSIFQADGRSEEGLGIPVMVNSERAGWLASGHVGRLVPRGGIDAGWLYLAFRSPAVQAQVKALACGSVVDALYIDELRSVVLPVAGASHPEVQRAWEGFVEGERFEAQAMNILDAALPTL